MSMTLFTTTLMAFNIGFYIVFKTVPLSLLILVVLLFACLVAAIVIACVLATGSCCAGNYKLKPHIKKWEIWVKLTLLTLCVVANVEILVINYQNLVLLHWSFLVSSLGVAVVVLCMLRKARIAFLMQVFNGVFIQLRDLKLDLMCCSLFQQDNVRRCASFAPTRSAAMQLEICIVSSILNDIIFDFPICIVNCGWNSTLTESFVIRDRTRSWWGTCGGIGELNLEEQTFGIARCNSYIAVYCGMLYPPIWNDQNDLSDVKFHYRQILVLNDSSSNMVGHLFHGTFPMGTLNGLLEGHVFFFVFLLLKNKCSGILLQLAQTVVISVHFVPTCHNWRFNNQSNLMSHALQCHRDAGVFYHFAAHSQCHVPVEAGGDHAQCWVPGEARANCAPFWVPVQAGACEAGCGVRQIIWRQARWDGIRHYSLHPYSHGPPGIIHTIRHRHASLHWWHWQLMTTFTMTTTAALTRWQLSQFLFCRHLFFPTLLLQFWLHMF